MLDPPNNNLTFADKRDKVGMDGVPNFLTSSDTELKSYMVIDIYKLFPKIEKN